MKHLILQIHVNHSAPSKSNGLSSLVGLCSVVLSTGGAFCVLGLTVFSSFVPGFAAGPSVFALLSAFFFAVATSLAVVSTGLASPKIEELPRVA